ncbi:CTB family bacteriocin [Nostoc sp. UIC 10607]|uniref:CTB family bacteriocin n=1 Tax=Nostoc sp. UIC 10607 TaxID=3045935 RepID=UPI0039A07127
MPSQIIISEFFLELSDAKQELLAGGADFELTNSNFAQRLFNVQGTSISSPLGNTANSTGQNNYINNAAQDSLGLR